MNRMKVTLKLCDKWYFPKLLHDGVCEKCLADAVINKCLKADG